MTPQSRARHECWRSNHAARIGREYYGYSSTPPKPALRYQMEPEPRWLDAIKTLGRSTTTALGRLLWEITSLFCGKAEIRPQGNLNGTEGEENDDRLPSEEIMSISSPELDFLRDYHAQLLKVVQLQRRELARREEESRQIERDLAEQTKIVEALRRERLAREEEAKLGQQN